MSRNARSRSSGLLCRFNVSIIRLSTSGQISILKHLLKCLFHFKDPTFSFFKNKIDKSRQLACIQYKNQNAVAYGCRDVVRILRQPNFKKSHIVSIPYIMSAKKFSNKYPFSKDKGKTNSNHEVLGLWQRSFCLRLTYLAILSRGTGIIKI